MCTHIYTYTLSLTHTHTHTHAHYKGHGQEEQPAHRVGAGEAGAHRPAAAQRHQPRGGQVVRAAQVGDACVGGEQHHLGVLNLWAKMKEPDQ